MAVIDPFDFQRIFITILAGSPEIFTFIFIALISGLAGYFRMDTKVTMIMYLVFAIVMSTYIGAVYVLIILIVGIITFYSISRMFNR
jgi:hypothetical protein